MRLFRHVTFTLRTTLVTAVVISTALAIALTLGMIAWPAYNKARQAIRHLWEDVAKQVAENATSQTLDYFQNAPVALRMIEGLVEEESLNVVDLEMIFDICYRSIKENPSFASVYYAKPDGSFYGVFKVGNDFIASHRRIGQDGKTLVRNYHIGPNHNWTLTNEELSDYDPRKRPFWKVGVEHPNGAWTEPYLFLFTNMTGYSYVLGQKNKDNVIGYWTVDFQIDSLSTYLHSLKIGNEGVIFIIANDGKKIAESTPSKDIDNQAWKNFIDADQQSGLIPSKHTISYVNRFPKESQIPWNLVTIIHENDFLLPIRKSALHSLLIGMIPCLAFLVLAAYWFGKMSRRLIEISQEMDDARNLSIHLIDDEKIPTSRIRELNLMNQSLHKMKVGLKSFSKYAPVDLIKKLLLSGHVPELGGEKKEITVLFGDLAQFTTFAEQHSAEEITKVLEDFLDVATREVHKEKGIIDKFMGDAVMALWGTPDPVANHPLAACRTALAMKKIAASNPNMKHKVGINSGPAVVGNFGSQERMDYTAIGDTINTASRFEKLNKEYGTQILLGPTTAEAVQETFLVRPIDWVTPIGKTRPVLMYELIDTKENASESLIQAVAAYRKGLDLYREKHFAEASAEFQKANTLFGGADTPSQTLIARCAAK